MITLIESFLGYKYDFNDSTLLFLLKQNQVFIL